MIFISETLRDSVLFSFEKPSKFESFISERGCKLTFKNGTYKIVHPGLNQTKEKYDGIMLNITPYIKDGQEVIEIKSTLDDIEKLGLLKDLPNESSTYDHFYGFAIKLYISSLHPEIVYREMNRLKESQIQLGILKQQKCIAKALGFGS